MIHPAVLSLPHWIDVTVILFAALFSQVTTKGSSCYREQCDINEFCCDGLCCSYFGDHWYFWTLLLLLLSVIVLTCFCFPRSPWGEDSYEPVYYYLFPAGVDVPRTKPYKQQPQSPQYHSFASESRQLEQYHPYRYERLVQQNVLEMTSPEPSAPPKSP